MDNAEEERLEREYAERLAIEEDEKRQGMARYKLPKMRDEDFLDVLMKEVKIDNKKQEGQTRIRVKTTNNFTVAAMERQKDTRLDHINYKPEISEQMQWIMDQLK